MRRQRLPDDLLMIIGLQHTRFLLRTRRFMSYCGRCEAHHQLDEQCPHLWDGDEVSMARLILTRARYMAGTLTDDTAETRHRQFIQYLIQRGRMAG